MRDITESDPTRDDRWTRLAIIGVAAAVIVATTLIAVQPRTRAAGPSPAPTPRPLPRSAGLLGAAFADSRQGWLLTGDKSAGGTLWRSADGGGTWALAFKVPNATLVGPMQLGSNGSGYVTTLALPQGVGPNGLWLTADFGRTFEEHPLPNPAGFVLIGLSAPADGSAHAFFSDEDFPPSGLIFERELGGGGTWTQVGSVGSGRRPLTSPPAEPIPLFGSQTRFAFFDELHGVIATQTDSAGLGVYRTVDGGRSWTYVKVGPPPNGEQLPPAAVSLSTFDGLLMLAVSFEAGTAEPATFLYESSDAGATWADPVGVPTEDGLESPAFDNPGDWWVPYGQAVVSTNNAGVSWFRNGLNLPGATTVKTVYPIDGLRAWAFGGGIGGPPQFLYRTIDGGQNWAVVKPPG